MTEAETVQAVRQRLNKVGEAAGVRLTVDERPVGLGDLVEQLVRAVLAEQRSGKAGGGR